MIEGNRGTNLNGGSVRIPQYLQLNKIESELSQVWLPGVHINIGGGSDDLLSESLNGDFERKCLADFDMTTLNNKDNPRDLLDYVCMDVRTSRSISSTLFRSLFFGFLRRRR
jgi:hypothetical protein